MNAAFLNGVSSHIFDYDDTHLKTSSTRPAPSPPRSSPMRRCTRSRARLPQRPGARRRDRVPDRQRRLSEPLRCRLAHHRHGRRVRRGRGVRQADGAERAADGLGARPRGLAAGGPARILRLDEQELQPGPCGRERPVRGDPGLEELHQLRRDDRGQARLGQHGLDQAGLPRDHRGPRHPLRGRAQHLQALRLRHRHAPGDRRGGAAPRREPVSPRTRSSAST